MRQIIPSKSNLVEKIIRDANGRLLRATFCVYENAGHVKARLLNAVYIDEKSLAENQTLILACPRRRLGLQRVAISENKIVSTFSSSNLYYVLGSKPRAPTI